VADEGWLEEAYPKTPLLPNDDWQTLSALTQNRKVVKVDLVSDFWVLAQQGLIERELEAAKVRYPLE